jgi:hypothetical protein
MFGFAAAKLNEFEEGKISRRRLIESLTLAATTVAATKSAEAAQQSGVTAAGINHVSYTCPNFKQAADWYSKLFNLDQVGVKDTEITLPFGKMGEQPYNVTAKDVPLTFLLVRTRPENNTPLANGQARPKATCVVNHMAYTIADFEPNRVKAQLEALGAKNIRGTGPNALHLDDVFGYDIELCGLANNALTDGA